MYVPNRATYEYPLGEIDAECIDPDPNGCLAEARFALEDALTYIGGYTSRVIGNVCELESAKARIRLALSALPEGE